MKDKCDFEKVLCACLQIKTWLYTLYIYSAIIQVISFKYLKIYEPLENAREYLIILISNRKYLVYLDFLYELYLRVTE